MKIEVNGKKTKTIKYPALMKSIIDDEIILMTRPGAGITLVEGTKGKRRSIGTICDNLVTLQFRLFEGQITLENE